jgi:hypothetical protein
MPRMTTGGTWTYPPGWTMYWKSGRMSQPVFGAGEQRRRAARPQPRARAEVRLRRGYWIAPFGEFGEPSGIRARSHYIRSSDCQIRAKSEILS